MVHSERLILARHPHHLTGRHVLLGVDWSAGQSDCPIAMGEVIKARVQDLAKFTSLGGLATTDSSN